MPVVLPGDDPFTSVSLNDTSAGGAPIRLGPGIIMSQEQASGASAVKAGVVRRAKQGGFWIEQDQKRV